MHRVTITLDDELMAELDRMIATRGYQNRSEAVRDLARAGLQQMAPAPGHQQACVAALAYVYDHKARTLSSQIVQSFHAHHDISLATMHVHLAHDLCLEVAILKGDSAEVQHVADHVIAERGVRHGRLMVIPVEAE